MNTRILLVVFLFFAVAKQEINSQLGFSHEIGIIAGPLAFYSDYGQRYDLKPIQEMLVLELESYTISTFHTGQTVTVIQETFTSTITSK